GDHLRAPLARVGRARHGAHQHDLEARVAQQLHRTGDFAVFELLLDEDGNPPAHAVESTALEATACTPAVIMTRWPTDSPERRARTCSSTPTTRSTGSRGARRPLPAPARRTSRSSCRSATR